MATARHILRGISGNTPVKNPAPAEKLRRYLNRFQFSFQFVFRLASRQELNCLPMQPLVHQPHRAYVRIRKPIRNCEHVLPQKPRLVNDLSRAHWQTSCISCIGRISRRLYMHGLMLNLRLALRQLRCTPGFALTVALTLAPRSRFPNCSRLC
jgi:hypothetical protein